MNSGNNNIAIFYKYYEKHKSGIFNFALRMLKDADEASEISQNVFVKFFDNLNAIKEESKIPAWLFTTARNEIYARIKHRKRFYGESEREDVISTAEVANPLDEAERNDLRELLKTELERLSELNREIFLLREYGGLSYKEIAEAVGLDESKVKSRLFKTRKKLTERISKLI